MCLRAEPNRDLGSMTMGKKAAQRATLFENSLPIPLSYKIT